MKSDISRQTFNPRKHYSRVIMQQGRVQLDADWNEQQDILLHRINTQTSDMSGLGDVSADSNGFEVRLTPDGEDLVITPGYIYLDGILCELERERTIDVQFISSRSRQITINRPDWEDSSLKEGHWIELLNKEGHVFLKDGQHPDLLRITNVNTHNEEVITLSFDQPFPGDDVYEIVKIRPVTTYLTQPNYSLLEPRPTGLVKLDTPDNEHILLVYLDVWERPITALNDPNIVEVALGGADTAQRGQVLWQVKLARVEIKSPKLLEEITQSSETEESELERKMQRLLRVLTFTPPLSEWKPPASTGRLSVPPPKTDSAETGTYQGLENQLYHVEIHEGGDGSAMPTFKWARNNASSLVPIRIEQGQVEVKGSGQGNLLGLTVGQYVEPLDERTELLGLPGHIAQIKQVNDITGLLTLDPPPPENAKQNRLRLWNDYAPIDGNKDRNAPNDGWIPLEDGVKIQFTQGRGVTYRSGDYWLIPARTATGKIEWAYKTPQPPVGVRHHYTRLACLLHIQSPVLKDPTTVLQDCRRRFFPLAARALHILDINWKNDFSYGEDHGHRLLKEGLRITLDGSPDPDYARAMQVAMVVSVETALPGGGAGIFIMNGHFKIEDNHIFWHWERKEKQGFSRFFAKFDEWASDLFDTKEHLQRVRVTLKGQHLWGTVDGHRIYLDGQAFGIPGLGDSGHRPMPGEPVGKRIDLQLPSGTGRPANDFESWFYIREEEREDEREDEQENESNFPLVAPNQSQEGIVLPESNQGVTEVRRSSFFGRIFGRN